MMLVVVDIVHYLAIHAIQPTPLSIAPKRSAGEAIEHATEDHDRDRLGHAELRHDQIGR